MKNIFAFSIKTVWKLIQYIRPLYEIIAAIVKIIKNDKKDEEELKNWRIEVERNCQKLTRNYWWKKLFLEFLNNLW